MHFIIRKDYWWPLRAASNYCFFKKKADRHTNTQTNTHTNRLGQKSPLIKVSYSKQRPKVKHFLGTYIHTHVHTHKVRVGLHRRFLAIFLKLPFHFVKRQFDFCRFCWLHKPKSVVLSAKLKFRKVKYFFSSHILENLRPNNKG